MSGSAFRDVHDCVKLACLTLARLRAIDCLLAPSLLGQDATMVKAFVLSAAFAAMVASAVSGQAVLTVRVTDVVTGTAIRGALVTIHQSRDSARALTDSTGQAQIITPVRGPWSLGVTAPGYVDSRSVLVEVGADATTATEVKLAPKPYPAAPVTAVASARNGDLEQNGFYKRKEDNRGFFIDRAEIEKRNTRIVSDLLRVVPGIRMTTAPGGGMAVSFQGNETAGFGKTIMCGPRIILDGVEMAGRENSSPTPVDNIVVPSDLAGIEIYRRPSQLPTRFGGAMSACGVIVLWTRLRS
jgi:hypothetical protein